jgi:hypothetical protein
MENSKKTEALLHSVKMIPMRPYGVLSAPPMSLINNMNTEEKLYWMRDLYERCYPNKSATKPKEGN